MTILTYINITISEVDTVTYPTPFSGVIDKADIHVYLNGVAVPFTVEDGNHQITLVTPAAVGDILHIKRVTDASNKLVDFKSGAMLTEADLDTAFDQVMFLAQEAKDKVDSGILTDFDGHMDAQDSRIVNVKAGVNPLDAVNMQQQGDYLDEVTAKYDEVVDKHGQLFNLTTQVDSMGSAPLGKESPASEYDPKTGLLKIWVADGPVGDTGATGALGSTGPTGPLGVQGIQGVQGEEGDRGPEGNDGPLGPTGKVGPQGTQGIVGPLGPTGATGPTGPQGVKGEVGIRGPIGIQGVTGIQGVLGKVGPLGPEGPKGIQGTIGIQGSKGDTGTTGAVGPIGPKGIQGVVGLQGPLGAIGGTGGIGVKGPAGPQGVRGVQGIKGDIGSQGTAGPLGLKGPTGNMGATPMALAFGRFSISDTGELLIEHYGGASNNDFKINSNGELEVTV